MKLNLLERIHKIVTIIVLMAMLLNAIGQPLLIVRETNAQYWAAVAQAGAANAITQPVLASECAGGTCNDEMASDFEVGRFISTTVVADTVQLVQRSIPQADAGDDRTLNESGNAIHVNGWDSYSPMGIPLAYNWQQTAGPEVVLYDADSDAPSFVPPDVTRDTTFNFELIVNDGANSWPDMMQVTLLADNDAPLADAGTNQSAHEGSSVTLNGWGSHDINDDSLIFTWSQVAGTPAALSDATLAQPSFTAPDVSQDEVLLFQLVVNDGQSDSMPDTVQIVVTADNESPIADAGEDQEVSGGSLVHLDGANSRDPNDDLLNYSWAQTNGPAVNVLGQHAANPIFVAPYVASNELLIFRLTVDDGEFSDTDTIIVTVQPQGEPTPLPAPSINSFDGTTGAVGTEVVIKGQNFDATNPANNKIFFNNILATTLLASPTTLVARVPEEATSGAITVNTPFGTDTSESNFTVTGQENSPLASRLSSAASALSSLQADPLSGSALTNIPIALPPGRQGVQPSLALHYNSLARNSWVGVGWNLHHSFVQRSTQHGKPSYDENDTFVVTLPGARLNLDNVELLPIGNNEYRAKIESSFARFLFDGSSWQMWDKDGTQYIFGTDNGQANNAFGTFRWYLERIVDTNGNYMTLSYTEDQGELYLSHIDYTGHEGTATAAGYRVDFLLEARVDAISSFVSGAQVITAKRLAAIEVSTNDELIRRYELGYAPSAASGRSLLTSLTEYGSDGMTPLPTVRFRYQHVRNEWELASAWALPDGATFTTSNGDYDNGLRIVDVNGDARADLVQAAGTASMGKHRTWLNTGTGYSVASEWLIPQEMAFTSGTYDAEDNAVRLADVNGDGLVDLVQGFGTDANKQRVYLHNGTGWSLANDWLLPSEAYFIANDRKDNAVRLADVNGDGLADLVQSFGTNSDRHRVWLNSGSGWEISTWTVPLEAGFVTDNDKVNGVQLADVNGDGLDDLVQSYGNSSNSHRVWLNNNHGWASAASIVPLGSEFVGEEANTQFDNGVRIADINADGRVDLIQAKDGLATRHRVWLNNGLAWDNPSYNVPTEAAFTESSGDHKDNGVRLADLNGDGLLDLIQSEGSHAEQRRVWLNSGKAPDLLIEVENGIGAQASVAYQPSTAYDNTGDDNQSDLPFVLQTAASVTVNDGMGNNYTVITSYANGLYDAPARDFRGFGYARITDVDGNYTESWFHQDDIYKGKPQKVEVHEADGTRQQQVLNSWDVSAPYPDATFAFLTQVESIYDSGSESYTTRERYEYDSYGNTTAVLNEGDIATDGDEVLALTDYAANTEKWILSRPSHQIVKDIAGTIHSESWLDYDGLPNGEVSVGNQSKKRSWLDSGADPEVTFGYDEYGNAISTIDARGKSTTTTYDSDYHTFPTSATNALGHRATTVYDPYTGLELEITDANAHTVRFEYDQFGTQLNVIQPGDSRAYPTLSYDYDLTTVPIKTTLTTRQERGSSNVWLSYDYGDGLGRSWQRIVEGREGKYTVAESVIYNARGLVERQFVPYTVETAAYVASPLDYAHTHTEHDALGRPTQVTNPDGTAVTTLYMGRQTQMIDEEGGVKRYTNDGQGRLVQVEEENGSDLYLTSNQYDPLGNLRRTTDDAGNVTTITYDSLSRKIALSDPDMGDWSYSYDANGNLIQQTDPKGQTISFEYDDLDRVLRKDYPSGSDILYSYDNPDVPNSLGRLSQVNDAAGTASFEYDALGRSTLEARTIEDVSYTILKSYDTIGRLSQLVYPDGAQVNYSYDSAGNLAQVSSGGVNHITYNDYNARGQVLQATYANGVVSDYSYDDQTLLLSHLLTKKNNTILQDLTYTFDNVANISEISDAANSASQTFEYDDLYRLTSATGVGWSRQYSYDSLGNMTSKSDVGQYTYGQHGAGPHAVTTAGANSYDYDANGNMTSGAGRTMTYDYDNRLTTVETITQTISFTYDGDGGRVKKTVSGNDATATTIYIGQLYEVSDGVAIRHIFSGEQRIASVQSTGKTYYYHQDHLGGSNSITDESGVQIQLLEYYPFGDVRVNHKLSDIDVPHKFTGKELDQETGLYFYGARYYDPVLARFISPDTYVQQLSDPQTLNRYTYARNNPLKYTDPTGHFFKKLFRKVKNLFKQSLNSIKKYLRHPLDFIKRKIIAPLTAGITAWLTTGNPIAGIVAAATVLLLDTGTGRKIIRQVAREFFDDILGLDPDTAQAFSSQLIRGVVSLGLNSIAGLFSSSIGEVIKTAGKGLKSLVVDLGKKVIKYHVKKYKQKIDSWLQNHLGLSLSRLEKIAGVIGGGIYGLHQYSQGKTISGSISIYGSANIALSLQFSIKKNPCNCLPQITLKPKLNVFQIPVPIAIP